MMNHMGAPSAMNYCPPYPFYFNNKAGGNAPGPAAYFGMNPGQQPPPHHPHFYPPFNGVPFYGAGQPT